MLTLGMSLGGFHAQNLVVNGGFESFLEFPNASGQLHFVSDWGHGGGASAVPDFFHEGGTGAGDLPQTPLAKVNAYKGKAIAGFVAYSDPPNAKHEYLTGRLAEPLKPGQRYRMSFAITSGRVHEWVDAGVGVSGLGVSMGFGVPDQLEAEKLDLEAQFEIHEALLDRNWRRFTFVFEANQPFTHFTFGLMGRNPRFLRMEDNPRTKAYYFMDDFVLEETSAQIASNMAVGRGERGFVIPEGAYVPNGFTPNKDGLNDTWNLVLPESMTWDVVVADRWGRTVWTEQVSHEVNVGWDGKDDEGQPCVPGPYAWRAVSSTPLEGQTVWKGWVNVLR